LTNSAWRVTSGHGSGEAVALVGLNGSCKTSTLKACFGLVRPFAGKILFIGQDVTRLPPSARMARGMAMVMQGRRLFGRMSIRENVELAAHALADRGQAKARVTDFFKRFPEFASRQVELAGHLSGGQQQALALARVSVLDPRLLLLDEPFLGLDRANIAQVKHALNDLRGVGTTLIIAEQRQHELAGLVDRYLHFEAGALVG
jgi:branched-chain amino acid transport system ATP-binding protein